MFAPSRPGAPRGKQALHRCNLALTVLSSNSTPINQSCIRFPVKHVEMGLASKLNQAAGPATTGQINANQMKTTNSSLNLGIWTKNTTTVDTFNNVPGTAVPGATPLPYQTGGMVQAAPGSYPQQQQQQYPATYPHQQQFYPAHVQQVPMQAGGMFNNYLQSIILIVT